MVIQNCYSKAIFVAILVFLLGIPNTSFSDSQLDSQLFNAVASGQIETVKNLLNEGADVNAGFIFNEDRIFCPITFAAASGNLEIVNLLLEKGAKIEGARATPNLPVYYATANNYPQIVKALVKKGIDPNYAWEGMNGGTLLT